MKLTSVGQFELDVCSMRVEETKSWEVCDGSLEKSNRIELSRMSQSIESARGMHPRKRCNPKIKSNESRITGECTKIKKLCWIVAE